MLPTAGLRNISDLKVHGNRALVHFPAPDAFPYVQTLALSYAYHCCPYVGRLQTPHPKASGGGHESTQLHDSILWFEDVSNVNLTIVELMAQYWKDHSDTIEGLSESEVTHLANLYGFGPAVAGGEEHPAEIDSALWTLLQEQQPKQANVYLQANLPHPAISDVGGHYVRCLPQPGPFQPCQDLFDWWTLRFGVWLVFPLAMIGNATVLIVLLFGRRRRRRRRMDVPRFLVCNLAAADFLMGIYLGMLALVDASTLGNFRAYAIRWQYSWPCRITGFLGVFSTELSVYTLSVITVERNYAITNAMHLNKRLSLRAATTIMSIGWVFAFILALLPLVGVSDYRKFAICLPFETDDSIWSMIYVLSLIGVNGIAFLLLMGCYLRMYCAIRGSQAWNSNDTRIAMRMALLVFTDFLCWAPIAFFTVTAVAGWRLISLEEAKIFAVFVLPLNACANPFLYAFFTKQFKKECQALCRRVGTLRWLGEHCFGKTRSRRDVEQLRPPSEPEGQQGLVQRSVPAGGTQLEEHCRLCGHPRSEGAVPSAVPAAAAAVAATATVPEADVEWASKIVNGNQTAEARSRQVEPEVDANDETGGRRSDANENKCAQCQCTDHKTVAVRHSSTIEMGTDTQTPTTTTWRATMRHLIGSLSNRSSTSSGGTGSDRRRSSSQPQQPGKQFKSNSIIYQSNYRKNHIHMTLVNEVRPTPLTATAVVMKNQPKGRGKMARHSSEDVIASATARQHQPVAKRLNSTPTESRHSRVETPRPETSTLASVSQSAVSPGSKEDKSSVSNSGHNNIRKSSSTTSSSTTRPEPSVAKFGDEVRSPSEKASSPSSVVVTVGGVGPGGGGGGEVTYTTEEIAYDVSHAKATPSAMASGIMMLKRKFIRKSNPSHNHRKLSTDSQYDYGRKDSTSTTGRLSFSSDNTVTKSTSSSFISSGVYSGGGASTSGGGGGGASNAGRTENCLLMNAWQYRRLLATARPADRAWCDHHLQLQSWTELPTMNMKTITLRLSRQELRALLREKHGDSVRINSAVRIKIVPQEDEDDNEEVEMSDEQEECLEDKIRLKELNASGQVDKLEVLYLLSSYCTTPVVNICSDEEMMETTFNETSTTSSSQSDNNNLDQLEVYLLSNSTTTATSQLKGDEDNSEVSLCSDCTKHYLINKLIEHLICNTNNFGGDRFELAGLQPQALLLRCAIQLSGTTNAEVGEAIDEIEEPQSTQATPTFGSSKQEDFGRKFALGTGSFKLKSSSHERIRNFLQNLLPRSSKKCKLSSKSANHKLLTVVSTNQRLTAGAAVETSLATRRSSSAFAIGELLYATDGQAKRIACGVGGGGSVGGVVDLCTKSCSQLQIVSAQSISNHSSVASSVLDTFRPRSVLSDVLLPSNSGHPFDYSPSSLRNDNNDSRSCKAAL